MRKRPGAHRANAPIGPRLRADQRLQTHGSHRTTEGTRHASGTAGQADVKATLRDRSHRAEAPEGWQAALSDAALRAHAGKAVFERGLAYFNNGHVTLERDKGASAVFSVLGTHPYRTELALNEAGLRADCDCPHAEDGAFCKHMVAAAFAWRVHLGGDAAAPPSIEPLPSNERALKAAKAAKAAETKARKRDDLKAFVETRDAATLASLLWARAERDHDLMAELKAWAASEQAGADPAALKTALDAVLKSTRDFLDWHEVSAYAQRARRALPLLETALARSASQALGAAEHALRRLYRVAEQADDSNGEIGDLMLGCIDIVRRALAQQPPPPAWADRFLELIDDDPFGLWDVDAVLDAAGAEVARRYSQALGARWAAIEAGRGKGDARKAVSWGAGGARTEADDERDRIRRLCIDDLERQGDVGTTIDFMKRSARSDFEHVQLIETCEKHGRLREALTLAEAAHKRDPKSALFESAVLRCWERDGCDDEAFVLRKRIYWREPILDHYRALLRAARAAGQLLDALRAEVEAMLVEREQAPLKALRRSPTLRNGSPLPDVTVRAQWLLEEGRAADALAVVQGGGGCHPQTILAVAARLGAPFNAQAFALLDRVARHEIERAQGRYDEALEVVALACARLDRAAAGPYLAQLKAEFKAKRNFVKGIEALHPRLAR